MELRCRVFVQKFVVDLGIRIYLREINKINLSFIGGGVFNIVKEVDKIMGEEMIYVSFLSYKEIGWLNELRVNRIDRVWSVVSIREVKGRLRKIVNESQDGYSCYLMQGSYNVFYSLVSSSFFLFLFVGLGFFIVW